MRASGSASVMARMTGALAAGAMLAFAQPASADAAADQAALKGPLALSFYSWGEEDPPVQLPRVATHICLLTAVQGKLAGPGDHAGLYIDSGAPAGPVYMLGGKSDEKKLRVTASCAPRNQFAPAGAAAATGVEQLLASKGGSLQCDPHTQLYATDAGTNVFFLSDIGGKFRGAGESLTATSLPRPGKPAYFQGALRATACSGNVSGGILSLSGGAGKLVKYRSLTERTISDINANFDTTFDGHTSVFRQPETIVPRDEAICGLTSMSGKFSGYGEDVGVVPVGSRWHMVSDSRSPDSPYVHATFRCYARDQR